MESKLELKGLWAEFDATKKELLPVFTREANMTWENMILKTRVDTYLKTMRVIKRENKQEDTDLEKAKKKIDQLETKLNKFQTAFKAKETEKENKESGRTNLVKLKTECAVWKIKQTPKHVQIWGQTWRRKWQTSRRL